MRFYGWILQACAVCHLVQPITLSEPYRQDGTCMAQGCGGSLELVVQEASEEKKADLQERRRWQCARCKQVYTCNRFEGDDHLINHNRLVQIPDPIALLQILDPYEIAGAAGVAR